MEPQPKKNKLLKIFVLLFILAILFAGYRIITKPRSSQNVALEQKIAPAKAILDVGRSFEFPASRVGNKGEEKVTFTIVSAELKDEIKVKGTPKEADKDTLFLVMRLEIDNKSSEKLSITPSDFIRLVEEQEKKFAPDFHNATIIIDPLSVRKDLVSFVVPDGQKNFIFSVGELEKEKEEVQLTFK